MRITNYETEVPMIGTKAWGKMLVVYIGIVASAFVLASLLGSFSTGDLVNASLVAVLVGTTFYYAVQTHQLARQNQKVQSATLRPYIHLDKCCYFQRNERQALDGTMASEVHFSPFDRNALQIVFRNIGTVPAAAKMNAYRIRPDGIRVPMTTMDHYVVFPNEPWWYAIDMEQAGMPQSGMIRFVFLHTYEDESGEKRLTESEVGFNADDRTVRLMRTTKAT
jgi:hypothetical protein